MKRSPPRPSAEALQNAADLIGPQDEPRHTAAIQTFVPPPKRWVYVAPRDGLLRAARSAKRRGMLIIDDLTTAAEHTSTLPKAPQCGLIRAGKSSVWKKSSLQI